MARCWDLFMSVRPDNILPLMAVGRDNMDLTEYLVEQVFQTPSHRFAALRDFLSDDEGSGLAARCAGQRVQIIKKDQKHTGVLEFGTEIVAAADHSLVALLGASPGASTAVWIMIKVLETCFPQAIKNDGWAAKLKQMIRVLR